MVEQGWLAAAEQAAWRAYLDSTRLLLRTLDRQLSDDSGLSFTDYELLVRLAEAPSYGLPGVVFDPAARGSVAYVDFAQEMVERIGKM